MKVILNDQEITVTDMISLSELLNLFGYTNCKVAVAVNSTLVSRSCYEKTLLQEKDVIDIIAPMQGG